MKNLMLLSLALVLSSCAVKRTRDSDKTLRIMLDPNSINEQEHVSVQNALIQSGKFYVVDRSQAFKAVKAEQERLHKVEGDRYEDSQKYAHWGKLYGVGGVVTAHVQCNGIQSRKNVLYLAAHLVTLGMFDKELCTQFLDLTDTNTGEVLVSVRYEATRAYGEQLDWSDIVDDLISDYPKYFEEIKKHEKLVRYEAESAEHAQRQREVANEKQ